jgi:hypothetical protein
MMSEKTINVAIDFTKFPGGRFREDGPGSGQEFREDFLLPALKSFDRVIVNFDGVAGYAASFLEESFGGAVVELGLETVQNKLDIKISDDPNLKVTIAEFMRKAASKLKG